MRRTPRRDPRGATAARGRATAVRLALAATLLLLAATPLLAACSRPVPADRVKSRLAEIEPLDVVLIVVDTLRPDFTTPYGFDRDTAPELARWAERGVLFERVRSQSSWTKISMASLMTSLWPRSHAIHSSTDGLAEGALTLAEVFAQHGYDTFGVQTNGWLDQSFGFQQGFDRYESPRGAGAVGLGKPSLWSHGDRVYEAFERFLEEEGREPFFVYLHLMDVHEYAAPPEFKRFGRGRRADYVAAIRWVDDVVERVRRKLLNSGLLDRTVMVFTSDHGEAFGENGVYGHAKNVLTPVLRVPLVLRLPFRVEPTRISAQVRSLDIAPTLLDLAGLPIPEGFEGESLLPLLEHPDVPDRPTFAALGDPVFRDVVGQVSVNDGTWTYARNLDEEGRELLFDGSVDPDDNVDLIELEPAQADRMRGLLDEHLANGGRGAQALERNVRIDPEIAKRLRAMGYLWDHQVPGEDGPE